MSNTKADDELLDAFIGSRKDATFFDFAILRIGSAYSEPEDIKIIKTRKLDELLNFLDFKYNCGFGSQHIFGVVCFNDGTWLERVEYDGSEWWELRQKPDFDKYEIKCGDEDYV